MFKENESISAQSGIQDENGAGVLNQNSVCELVTHQEDTNRDQKLKDAQILIVDDEEFNL